MNLSLVSKHLRPNSCLDIGANVGNFYREASKEWPNCYFMLVEGNPYCADELGKLGVSHRIALLSDEEKAVTFYTQEGHPTGTGASYYRENTSFYEGTKAVPHSRTTQRLDTLLIDHVYDLLKLDTQGSELDILRGGLEILSRAKAVILEISHIEYNQGAPDQSAVNDFMREHGFHPVENLGEIHHPISGEHIQTDVLFLRK